MRGRYAGWVAAISLMALASGRCAAAGDSFRSFQAAYGCDVVQRLRLIHATGNPASPLNRYLVIGLQANDYVQCIFHARNSRALCEASSGFWTTRRGRERTAYRTPRTIAALARLGFNTDDSAGNFRIDRPAGSPEDIASLAELMLRTLHDGYGARSDNRLTFKAPFAPNRPAACVPTS